MTARRRNHGEFKNMNKSVAHVAAEKDFAKAAQSLFEIEMYGDAKAIAIAKSVCDMAEAVFMMAAYADKYASATIRHNDALSA